MLKKTVATMLAISILLMCSVAFAKETTLPSVRCDYKMYKPQMRFKDGFTYGESYRDQLTDYEKTVYDAIANTVIDILRKGEEDKISLPVPQKAPESTYVEVAYEVFDAFFAFDYDHPEYFWLTKQSGAVGFDVRGGYLSAVYLEKTELGWWCSPYTSYEQISADEKLFNETVEKLANEMQGMGRYTAVKYIHDYITWNNEYNEYIAGGAAFDTVPEIAWTAASALIEHDDTLYDPVCEGYARAVKVLCDRINIPCAMVSGEVGGEGHIWDLIKMPNGLWFCVDATFDDEPVPVYTWFMRGSNFMGQTHIPGHGHVAFAPIYPLAYEKDYPQFVGDSLGDANLDGKLNTGDSTKILKHIADIEKLTSAQQRVADFNLDGDINTGDCVCILHYLIMK